MTAMPLALTGTLEAVTLPAKVREKKDLLAKLVQDVIAAPYGSKKTAWEIAARQMRAAGYDMSADAIRAQVAAFKTTGTHALIDKRKVPHDDNKLPAAFKQHVKKLFQRQGRSEAQAHEELLKDWRAGKPIPGYPIHPKADPFHHHPHGWSLKNLQRVCRSTPFEKAAMRVGLGYAKAKHGVKHFTTRKDLWHLSHIFPDDVEHDKFVFVGTKSQSCRVAQLGMVDCFSGNYFCYGTRPMLKKWDAKKDKYVIDGLKEANMRFLLAMQLFTFGYSPLGTVYPVELGTATIRDDIARILHDRTKERHGEALIKVDLSGWTGKKQIVEGMFVGRGGGNPRHKAPLESLHNLLHNMLAALPGSTGPDVARRPEQLFGMLNAQEDLMDIAKALTPWQAEQLIYPLMEYNSQFLPVLAATIDAMNKRRKHNLEGWHELDFVTDQYRFHRESEEWISKQKFLELPGWQRAMLDRAVREDTALHRPVKLSPHEVFAMQRGGAVEASIAMIAEILYADLAVERKCKDGYFEFHDQEIGPEILRYHSRVCTVNGREEELFPDTYEVVVNPFQPDLLWVYRGKRGQGGFLGTARRVEKSSRVDQKQAARTLGYEQKRYEDMAEPLREIHADIAREEKLRLKHNNEVIDQTPEEKDLGNAAERALQSLSTLPRESHPETNHHDNSDTY